MARKDRMTHGDGVRGSFLKSGDLIARRICEGKTDVVYYNSNREAL